MLALSQQLKATAKVVAFVMAGRSLSELLQDQKLVLAHERAGVQALSFSVLRQLGMAKKLRALLVPRAPSPALDALLCSALALLVCEQHSGTTYDEFTLVNQAVDAAKADVKTRAGASFINAVLRRFLREREGLIAKALESEEAQYNHPKWWIDALRIDHPKHWRDVLAINQIRPSMTVRVNTTKVTFEHYQRLLSQEGIAFSPIGFGDALVLSTPRAVQALPGYQLGWFSIQDWAAQNATTQLLCDEFLLALKQETWTTRKVRVLDACAAPGGKTTHMLERLERVFGAGDTHYEVLALELDSHRAMRIHENLSRLGQQATVKVADAAHLSSWWDGQLFDAVLLDAPCSASGIVRRHPDIRWLRRVADIEQLSKIQLELLRTLWQVLRPNGRLLYATCSIFQAEGAQIVHQFLKAQPQAKQLDSHGLWLPTLLPVPHDGFYDALFEKNIG